MFNLKKLRDEKNITQSDAATLLGCKQPNISAIENNGKDLTNDQLEILIDNLGRECVMQLYSESNSVLHKPEVEYKKTSQTDLLLEIMKQQSESLSKKDEQIGRLITLLENQLNK